MKAMRSHHEIVRLPLRPWIQAMALSAMATVLTTGSGCGGIGNSTPQMSSELTPPIAVGGESRNVFVDEVLTFDGSLSSDGDGQIESILWDFGDGSESTELVAMHSYAEKGGYVVRLTVTDNDGLSDTAEVIVTVDEPVLSPSVEVSPETVGVFETVSFDASGSTGPADLVAFRWDFGDGDNAEGIVVEHAYASPGSFNILLEIEDARGETAQLTGFVEVLPMDVGGQWYVTAETSSYSCAEYDVVFEDTALTLAVEGDGSLTATSLTDRQWEGTLEGSSFTLSTSYIGLTGPGCINAPVSSVITGAFDSDGHFSATVLAYYDLGVPCQCSATFSISGTKQ